MKRLLVLALFLAVTLIGSLSASAYAAGKSEYWVDESSLPFEPLLGFEDSTRLWGIHARAGYQIEVPANWNGDLVMWAHGLRAESTYGQRLFPDSPDPVYGGLMLRPYWLENGYAWAASTYSMNDFAGAAAVQDTKRLVEHFTSLVGMPNRVYITGRSMGGFVAALSVEHFPNIYDGALPACGALSGLENFDVRLDFNLAAEQIALGTSSWPVDPDTYFSTTVPAIKEALLTDTGSWPTGLNADGLAFKQLMELRTGGDRPNYDQAWLIYNLVPALGTGVPGDFMFDSTMYFAGTLPRPEKNSLDNTDVVYQVDLDPDLSAYEQTLNAEIFRLEADPSTRAGGGLSHAHVPPLDGDLSFPVLTMHTLGDLVATFQNEIDYYHLVAAQGNTDYLVQRAYRGIRHCNFTSTEWNAAFSDLVNWVEMGVRPAGDSVHDPAIVAAPDYGCQFTDFAGTPPHLYPEPCP